MVAKYKKILRQLNALKKFKEITTAIRFVAGGELGKLRKEIKKRYTPLDSIVPLFNKKSFAPEYDQCLIVPITDDRGTCGPHNHTVIVATHRLVSSCEDENKNILMYAIGKKGKFYFKKFYKKYFVGYACNIRDVKFTIDSCFFILEKLLSFNFQRCYLVFNRYFSTQLQKALAYQLCSYQEFVSLILSKANAGGRGSIYFDSIKNNVVYNNFLSDLFYFGSSLLLVDAMENNRYSFLASRYTAMDNAIKNSSDMIERLTIIYNKARQEYITTELIEIISCKEAIVTEEIVSESESTFEDIVNFVTENMSVYSV